MHGCLPFYLLALATILQSSQTHQATPLLINPAAAAEQAACDPSSSDAGAAEASLSAKVPVAVVKPAPASMLRQQPKPLDGAALPSCRHDMLYIAFYMGVG